MANGFQPIKSVWRVFCARRKRAFIKFVESFGQWNMAQAIEEMKMWRGEERNRNRRCVLQSVSQSQQDANLQWIEINSRNSNVTQKSIWAMCLCVCCEWTWQGNRLSVLSHRTFRRRSSSGALFSFSRFSYFVSLFVYLSVLLIFFVQSLLF